MADAEAGEPFGGTGFFVGYPIQDSEFHFVYAVTNWHVAVKDGMSVIRVNTTDGGTDIFDLDASEWEYQPHGHDIAVASIVGLVEGKHRVDTISTRMFVDPPTIAALGIGAGEDVFMAGRFVDHDGAASNSPAVRFGHISTMLQEIEQPTGAVLPSFILDMHSRTGYSGSPVFVYRTLGSI